MRDAVGEEDYLLLWGGGSLIDCWGDVSKCLCLELSVRLSERGNLEGC
jgi:hypothetical protein